MTGLLQVGKPPQVTRSPGRKPGKWRGHEQMAQELRVLASRERHHDERWGKVAEQLSSTKSQSISGAIKKGEALGFQQTDDGCFEALTRRSGEVSREDKSKPLYEVWARWVPRNET